MDFVEAPIEEWVMRMPVDAFVAARKLERNCDRCGLDYYAQAFTLSQAANGTDDEPLWQHVLHHAELVTMAVGWRDRFLISLDP